MTSTVDGLPESPIIYHQDRSRRLRRSRRARGRRAPAGAVASVLLALTALPALGQDRVAQLSKVSGAVEITRAEDGRKDQARQVGPRVRGGSVFAGDVVATLAGAGATMVFGDGTRVELSENTSLTVREVDLSAMVLAGQRDKPLGRRIKILAGDVYSEIVENPGVLTEFETPSGVAAVKGTKLSISVGRAGEP